MSTTLVRPRTAGARPGAGSAATVPAPARRLRHALWLTAAFPFSFAVPFVLAETLELERDLYYGLYVLAVCSFVAAWARSTRLTRDDLTRNWRRGAALGAPAAAILTLLVLRTEDPTPRPDGLDLAAAVAWRGIVYGVTDGVLLSVFPILAVFGAFAGTRVRRRRAGVLVVGAVALAASLGITATYHLGYSDFRSEKLRKPLVGDAVWSAPTLLTASPLGAPVAHAALHVAAVLHSYDTDTFLPPHASASPPAQPSVVPATAAPHAAVAVYLLRGEVLAPAARSVRTPAVAAGAVRMLLHGPSASERATGLSTAVPAGTRLRSVRIGGGTATVDLTGRFASGGGSLSMAARLAQVTYTLTQLPNVRAVVYLLDGRRIDTLGGEGILVEGPQTRARYERAPAGSLDGGLLGSVFVDRPAAGAPFARALRITGTSTRTFTATVVDWDGLVVAERTIRNATGTRRPYRAVVAVEPGLYPRGALIVRDATGATFEIPLGSAR